MSPNTENNVLRHVVWQLTVVRCGMWYIVVSIFSFYIRLVLAYSKLCDFIWGNTSPNVREFETYRSISFTLTYNFKRWNRVVLFAYMHTNPTSAYRVWRICLLLLKVFYVYWTNQRRRERKKATKRGREGKENNTYNFLLILWLLCNTCVVNDVYTK